MGNFREYTKMKEEKSVKLKIENNTIILEIDQFNIRTGEKSNPLIQRINPVQLENEIKAVEEQKKIAKDRYDKQILELNKRIKNVNLLKKDSGLF